MRTCLIADASQVNRRRAASIAGRLGYQPMEVSSADGLKKAYRRFRPDLTLMDQSVSPGSLEVLVAGLRYGYPAGTGLILVTGQKLEAELISDSLIAGADDYLAKPFDDALLSFKLRQLTGAQKAAVGDGMRWDKGPGAQARGAEGNVIQLSDWR